LRQVSATAESLLEPIYKHSPDKALTYKEASGLRLAFAAASLSTRRPISATRIGDQLLEQAAFASLHNRSPVVELRIGTTPNLAMTEHLELLAASYGPYSNQHNGKTLLSWVWSAWDYYVYCMDKRLILDPMERLTDRYVQGPARVDVLDELIDIKADTDELILESQSFGNECYKTEVGRIIKGSGGRDKSLGRYTSKFAASARLPAGQDLGLSDDSLKDTAPRLTVGHTEPIPNQPTVYHRTSLLPATALMMGLGFSAQCRLRIPRWTPYSIINAALALAGK
jgi:hypothetical protein